MKKLIPDLIKCLNEDEIKLFNICYFDEQEIIFHQNEHCEEVDIVASGDLMMITYDENGNENVFNVIGPNSIFGNNLLFSSAPFYLSNVIALSKGFYYSIKKNDLLTILRQNSKFFLLYMQIIADKTINLTRRLKVISIQNASKRLLAYLEFKNADEHWYSYKSITKLAKEISLPRETTSRIVSKLILEGKLLRSNKSLKINKSA